MKKTRTGSYLFSIMLVFIVAAGIYHNHYEKTVEIIKSEYAAKIELVEQSIYNETKYTEIISKIAERDINRNMKEYAQTIAEYYEENPNIVAWDIEEMNGQLNGMEIYILDQDLNIVTSSVEGEMRLNSSAYLDLSEKLKEILKGNKFESEAINFSILQSGLRKYGYMPTLDNKYLIELSIRVKDIYPEIRNLNIVYLSDDLKNQYPFVEDIRVYKYNKEKQTSQDVSILNEVSDQYMRLTKDQNEYIERALKTNIIQEHTVKDEENRSYTIKYIPYAAYYERDRFTWWKSYAIEVIYDDQIMLEDISAQTKMFVQGMVVIAIFYFGFSYIIFYLLQQNRQIAYRDHLTRLPNRKRFEEEMESKMIYANRKGENIAVLFFDLDKFKEVNDTFGHNLGDKVLQEVANRLKSVVPNGDMVSRLGGDEFIVLLSEVTSQEEIAEMGEIMSELFVPKMKIGSEEIYIKPSIGISIYPEHGCTTEELMLKADAAMYEAKENGLKYKVYSK